MSNRFLDKGRQNFAAGAIAFLTGTIVVMPIRLDGSLTDTAVKQITAITTATPPVVTTSATHGFTTNDIVVHKKVAGMLNALGTFKITVLSGTTYSLQTLDGQNVVGTGTFTGTAGVINLTLAATWADLDGALCTGAPTLTAAAALTTKTDANGVLKADPVNGITLNDTVDAVITLLNVSNTAASSLPFHFADGRTLVRVVATAATSATSIAVEPLEGPIVSGTVIQMTNGVTVTTSANGVFGDRTLTVSALSAGITAGHHGDAQTTSSGLPITATSGTFNHQIDTTNGIGTL